MCQYICSYLLFINIPVCIYIYSYKPDEEIYLYDIIGVSCLAVTSYQYHYNAYQKLQSSPNNSSLTLQQTKDTIIYFYNDLVCINLRSFLVLLCNYYYTPHFTEVTIISSISHTTAVYLSTINILQLLNEQISKDTFLQSHYIANILSCGIDISLFFMNSKNEIAVPYAITNIGIILAVIFTPLDKLNHVLVHVLLILQTYYMCLSNINSNDLKTTPYYSIDI
jgi:hypothetical protein